MKRLRSVVAAVALSGLALAASAGATTRSAATIRHVHGRIEALALDGDRIAYDVGPSTANRNKVLVWNVQTGRTTTVSGNRTRHADDTGTGAGVFQLAVSGTRVAWLVNQGGNTEGDDYLYSSSTARPKERKLGAVVRTGDACAGRSQPGCAGDWLGGLVGSDGTIAVNRWTTDAQGAISTGELDLIAGRTLKQIATGTQTVEAVSADGRQVAVLRADGTVGVYSSTGSLVREVTPSSARAVALSGHDLVVLTNTRTLELYNTQTGNRRKTIPVSSSKPKPANLGVHGKIAVYTIGSAVHAVNLSSRKDRVIGKLGRGLGLARIGSAGVVYSSSRFSDRGTLVFLPWPKVAAAVA